MGRRKLHCLNLRLVLSQPQVLDASEARFTLAASRVRAVRVLTHGFVPLWSGNFSIYSRLVTSRYSLHCRHEASKFLQHRHDHTAFHTKLDSCPQWLLLTVQGRLRCGPGSGESVWVLCDPGEAI